MFIDAISDLLSLSTMNLGVLALTSIFLSSRYLYSGEIDGAIFFIFLFSFAYVNGELVGFFISFLIYAARSLAVP